MSSIRLLAKRTSLSFAAALVALFFPGMAFADSATDAAPTDTSQVSGPQQPTGADSKTFHYNSETGKWENDHYFWDPATKQTTPKDPGLTYDPTTGKWSTSSWHYDAPSGGYKEVKTPAPAPMNSDNQAGQSAGTGATTTANIDGATATAIANGVTSTAISGDATVAYNTLGGNATSGNAMINSTTLNLLQSGIRIGDGTAQPTTFVADINGNVTGDLVIDPALLALLQPASNGSAWTNTDVNVANNGQITNNISLDAATGNATVDSNTAAGNATTGDANAVANVMNLANSMVTANGSFIGLVNIYGDLEGDILLPPGVLQQLLASNAAASTAGGSNSLALTNTDSQNIENNINTSAASGEATVANNTSAGNATSGKSATNVTILNLTGHQVVAADSLLVFVNVLGQWVGAIVNAPGGSTAAALGDGATALTSGNTSITNSDNTNIVNNIDVNAASGDATVTNNTNAGNATSGDATAGVNLLNMTNSSLSLSGWFGIMFINVFGTWHGSFGVDTAMGNAPSEEGSENTAAAETTTGPSTTTALLRAAASSRSTGSTSEGDAESSDTPAQTLAATTGSADSAQPPAAQSSTSKAGGSWKLAGLGMLIAALLLAVDRFRTMRTQHAS